MYIHYIKNISDLAVDFSRQVVNATQNSQLAGSNPPKGTSGFLPDFFANRTVFLTILLAELFAFVLTLAKPDQSTQFWLNLAQTSLAVLWITLVSAAVLSYWRHWINRSNATFTTLAALCVTESVTLLFSVLSSWYIAPYLDPDLPADAPYLFIARNLAIAGIVTLIVLRYFYIQHQWQQNVEAEAHARLQALQARIHPHFLFNTLNTIASLIRSQPDQAEQAVLDLADLLRSALTDRVSASLAEELELTRRYLAIERLRMGERLQVDWQLDADLPLDTPLPPLLLQPLAENAIRHGIQRLPMGGTLTIQIERQPRFLSIAITNPCAPTPGVPGHGTAQSNIRQRLQLAYGIPDLLHINATPDRYQARMSIPLVKLE